MRQSTRQIWHLHGKGIERYLAQSRTLGNRVLRRLQLMRYYLKIRAKPSASGFARKRRSNEAIRSFCRKAETERAQFAPTTRRPCSSGCRRDLSVLHRMRNHASQSQSPCRLHAARSFGCRGSLPPQEGKETRLLAPVDPILRTGSLPARQSVFRKLIEIAKKGRYQ